MACYEAKDVTQGVYAHESMDVALTCERAIIMMQKSMCLANAVIHLQARLGDLPSANATPAGFTRDAADRGSRRQQLPPCFWSHAHVPADLTSAWYHYTYATMKATAQIALPNSRAELSSYPPCKCSCKDMIK
jgi:hypothetical protein